MLNSMKMVSLQHFNIITFFEHHPALLYIHESHQYGHTAWFQYRFVEAFFHPKWNFLSVSGVAECLCCIPSEGDSKICPRNFILQKLN